MRSLAAAIALLALQSAACIEVENPSVCTNQGATLPPGGGGSVPIPVDLGNGLPLNGKATVDAILERLSVSVAAPATLAGVTSATLSIGGSSVAHYTAGAPPAAQTIEFVIDAPDISPYVANGGKFDMVVTFQGAFAGGPGTIYFCADIKASAKLL